MSYEFNGIIKQAQHFNKAYTGSELQNMNFERAKSSPYWNDLVLPNGDIPSFAMLFNKGVGFYGDFRPLDEMLRACNGVFTRDSTATYFDRNGILRTAGPNVPRLTHDPVTGAALGYLAEPSRTNLITRSQDFADAVWTKTDLDVDPSATMAPDGTMTGSKLSVIAGGSPNSGWAQRINAGITPGVTDYAGSVYLKKGNTPKSTVQVAAAGGTAVAKTISVTWNPDGTVASFPGGFYEYVGGGWYRFWVSVTSNASNTIVALRVYVREQTAPSTGDFVYAWGGQLEVGKDMTSYIPTTTATVTRAADAMSVPLAKLPFNPAEFTLLAVAQPSSDRQNSANVLASLNKDASNLVSLRNSAAGSKQVSGFVYAGGVTQASIVSAVNDGVSRFRMAFGAKTNDFELVVNGVSKGTDLSGTVPAGLTSLVIGDAGASAFGAGVKWGAPIEAIILVPRRLSQAEMIEWSTL